MKRKSGLIIAVSIIAAIILVMNFGYIAVLNQKLEDLTSVSATGDSAAGMLPVSVVVDKDSESLVDLCAETIPAVCEVKAQTEVTAYYQDLWGRKYSQKSTETAAGSAFIISSDGYLLTNYHVVYCSDAESFADTISIEMYDGTVKTAQIIASDSKKDIALLKIDAENCAYLNILSDSENVFYGESVIAVGNALGNGISVTDGIISVPPTSSSYYSDVMVIQTTAPINPGNSGGPLIDMKGNVIGINSYKQLYSDSSSSVAVEGTAFAISYTEINDFLSNNKI